MQEPREPVSEPGLQRPHNQGLTSGESVKVAENRHGQSSPDGYSVPLLNKSGFKVSGGD